MADGDDGVCEKSEIVSYTEFQSLHYLPTVFLLTDERFQFLAEISCPEKISSKGLQTFRRCSIETQPRSDGELSGVSEKERRGRDAGQEVGEVFGQLLSPDQTEPRDGDGGIDERQSLQS